MPEDPDHPDRDTAPMQAQPESSGWVLGGRYRVLDRLGRGGMAEVFRAHDDLLDRDVAVKVFRAVMDDDGDTHGEVRRELELQSLARLSHPNLITLFDGSVAGDGPAYLVLELVHGPDLASRLSQGALPEPEVRELGAQIADALAYVHARGMVHRDVKPANILLGVDDALPGAVRARLSDFGIVRMVGTARMTAADLTLGTAFYVAPEQARGANVGPPADVYALALVLIEALTGVRCFDGPMHEALAARLTTAPQIPSDLPAPWAELLAAMTAADPAARPDAAEVARSLREGVAPAVPSIPAGAAGAIPAVAIGAIPAAAMGAVPVGLASADTAAIAATGAVPAGGTGAIPFAAGGPPPPVTYAGPAPDPVAGRPRRGRRGATLLLAGVVFAALLAGAGFLLLGGPSNAPAGTAPTTSTTHDPTTPTPTRTRSVSQAADLNNQPSGPRSVNRHSPSKHSAPTRSPSAAQPSSSPHSSQPVVRTTSPTSSETSSGTASSASASSPSSSAPSSAGQGGADGSPGPPP